jgi:GNAT superfamily N-acetyltransferase
MKGRKFLQLAGVPLDLESNEHDVLVPICHLRAYNLADIQKHLLSLNPQDRYLRFGYVANDAHITNYVRSLNFERDEIFGVFNRRLALVAMAHMAISVDPQYSTCAEFGVSVATHQRGKGIGSRLFSHVMVMARNEGVNLLFIHALNENVVMLKIARNAGARVERDGTESEAFLVLPEATLDSQLSGLVQEQMAELDYQIKNHALQFRDWLATVQEIRQGVRDARTAGRKP